MGILNTPGIDTNLVKTNTGLAIITYSPKMLLSLYLVLFGIAIFFFGSRLVYELYMFFNTEIFFESDLILFGAYGNYDEFEQITGGVKRKDTFTDFTPDIQVCKILSSIFIHPYLQKESISNKPRFIVKIEKDDEFMEKILKGFKENMSGYMMPVGFNSISSLSIEDREN